MRYLYRGVMLGTILCVYTVFIRCEHKNNHTNIAVISQQDQYPIKEFDSNFTMFKQQQFGSKINMAGLLQQGLNPVQMIALINYLNSEQYKQDVIQAQQQKEYEESQQAMQLYLQQQAQEKLQKTKAAYHQEIFNLSQASTYLEDRQQALDKTKQEKYKEHVQTHELDAQTEAMLQAHGIDNKQFKQLSGTIFQHQLFDEIVLYYKKIAKVAFEYQIKNSLLVPGVLDLGSSAFDATRQQLFPFAMQLNDLAEFMADSSLSLCKGVIESACDFVDMYVLHPIHTAKQFTNLTMSILHTLGGALHVMDTSSSHVQHFQSMQKAFDYDIHKFHAMCELSRQAYAQWYQHTPMQTKIETSSKYITDAILHPYLLGKAAMACWSLIKQGANLRLLENLGSLADELGATEFIEDIAQTTQPEQQVITSVGDIEESMMSLFESESGKIIEKAVQVTSKPTMSLKDVLKRLHSKGASYNDPQFQKEVLLHFNEQFCKEKLLCLSQKAIDQYSRLSIVHKGKSITLVCKPEHILMYDLKFQLNKTTGLIEGRIYGGHSGILTNYLKEQQIINIVEEFNLACGGRGLKYKHSFGKTIEMKTEFCSSFTQEQIMQNITEVLNNEECLYFDTWFNGSKQKRHQIGCAKDGSIIEIYLLEFSDDIFFLETAYPYSEKYSKIKGLICKN